MTFSRRHSRLCCVCVGFRYQIIAKVKKTNAEKQGEYTAGRDDDPQRRDEYREKERAFWLWRDPTTRLSSLSEREKRMQTRKQRCKSTFELVTTNNRLYWAVFPDEACYICNLILSVSWYQSQSWLAGLAITTKHALYLWNMHANCCINVVAYYVNVIMSLLSATSFRSI